MITFVSMLQTENKFVDSASESKYTCHEQKKKGKGQVEKEGVKAWEKYKGIIKVDIKKYHF